ncbi:protransforming growth factor alpha isoform X1 [Moschus berezovskii]|uniref:protransforming growth factor alpha isoform X1 n=1 Tax=Moschus berezovskii TaxID=68408 RepID=UPI0024451033|nr:protransforming growth factor alpha isoform X1 [Moschus berezovskii]
MKRVDSKRVAGVRPSGQTFAASFSHSLPTPEPQRPADVHRQQRRLDLLTLRVLELWGIFLAVCQALENSTSALSADPPVAAAVVSHFNDCPDSHSQFCFHGTCRFLVQEEKPACVCHSGYVGARCEHADLLAVVAASQKKQAITALVVVSIVALAVLIITCVLIHCCEVRKHCEWCRALICRHEKPSALLKGRTACCHSETVV